MMGALAGALAGCASRPPAAPEPLPAYGGSAARGGGAADVTTGDPIEGLVQRALRAHPTLRAEHARWVAAREGAEAAARWPEPSITWMPSLLPVETRLGPQRHRFALRQPLPWPTMPGLMQGAARARADVQRARLDARIVALRAAIVAQWWAVWGASERARLLRTQVALVEGLVSAQRARVEVASAPLSSLTQLQLALTRTRDALTRAQQAERAARATLRKLALLPADAEALPDTAPAPTVGAIAEDPATLRRDALAHPQQEALRRALVAATRDAAVAQQAGRPGIVLGVDYAMIGPAAMPNTDGSGRDALSLSLGVTIPIWQRRYQADADAATARQTAARADLDASRAEVPHALDALLIELDELRRRDELATRALIPQARAAFETTRGDYEAGRASIAALILAQRELLDVQLQQAEARAAWAQIRARLELLVGRPVKVTP